MAPRQLLRLGPTTLVYVAGIGETPARSAADHLLAQGARALVSWGTAGALEQTLAPGDLVLPPAVADPSQRLGVDPVWHARLVRALDKHLPVHTGTLIQSEELLATPKQKAELFHKSGAAAVDMESAAIGQAAARAHVPFLIIRAIVDTCSMPIPRAARQAADDYGKIKLRALLSGLGREPLELGALLRLSWNFRTALATLRTVARLTGPMLCYNSA